MPPPGSGNGDQSAKFVASRTFSSPREAVFRAFTEPDQMKQWWPPKGFTMLVSNMDLRPGGSYHYAMRAPDGTEMWGKFVFREVVPPERLVLVNSFSDPYGGLTRHPMSATWPLQMLSVFRFDAQDGGTVFSVEWSPLDPTVDERATFDASHEGMAQGWSGTLDQLAAYLAKRT